MVALPRPTSGKVRYLVLESPAGKPLLRKLYEHHEAPVWQHLFNETLWAAYVDESPVVVQAAQESEMYKWALNELKLNNELSGIVIESDETMDAVVAWVRERLIVAFDGGRKGLLRFYDPLIWHRLKPRNIGEHGPIKQVIYWHGRSHEGRWLVSRNPEPVTMAGTPVLEPEQLKRLSLAVADPLPYQLKT